MVVYFLINVRNYLARPPLARKGFGQMRHKDLTVLLGPLDVYLKSIRKMSKSYVATGFFQPQRLAYVELDKLTFCRIACCHGYNVPRKILAFDYE